MANFALLLATAALFAVIGWAVWHYFGSDAMTVIPTAALIAIAADNARLRRQLQAASRAHKPE